MSRSLSGLRALTLTASLLAGSTAAVGQDQKPTEEDHRQHEQQPGNEPQDHSQHDMSKMAGIDHPAMGHSGMNSSGMFPDEREFRNRVSARGLADADAHDSCWRLALHVDGTGLHR